MKNKKLFLPAIILAAAILAIAVYSLISSVALKPTVTEAKFPFKITYELDGEAITIDDVYQVNYVPNDADNNHKGRVYTGKCLSSGEDDTIFILKQDENTLIELRTQFYANYLMGEPDCEYFEDEAFEPVIYYYGENEVVYHDEETLAAQGVKLLSFEYPTPIENTFVFSHFSYLSGDDVPQILLIALLALLAIIIFVRKEKERRYTAIDIVSIVFNWVIGTVYMGFVAVLALLIDIEGGGPDLYYQVTYFIPVVSALCLAASVALRRKGYSKSSLVSQFIGPAFFALYLLIFYVGGSL